MRNNPYVGPRPFERQDQASFFGRASEARDLQALVRAERVVLLYAQSGAGKTSLLNAQIIPALEEKRFLVLPSTRVGSDLPPGINPSAVENIFVLSALTGLAGPKVAIRDLLGHTLLSFVRERACLPKGVQSKPPVLILDQFEEIFTTHRDRWQNAHGFFEQLHGALNEIPTLSVIIAMREDHVAELDPFLDLLPKRLRPRLRLEQLSRAAALEAIERPAAGAGRPFGPGVAERLADDLSRIRVAAPSNGSRTEVIGPIVEPVQLQVVCCRLWGKLPDGSNQPIRRRDIVQFGDIDSALTDFYVDALKAACTDHVTEHQLRRWFSEKLITPVGTRGLALHGKEQTAGLPNSAVAMLENHHLIRAEMRAGSLWYELAHDRLIEPIKQSNSTWEAERQTPLRLTAQEWKKVQNDALLYRDNLLGDWQEWAEKHSDEIEPEERDFLEASQRSQQRRGRRRRLYALFTVGLVVVLMVVIALAVAAVRNAQAAEDARAVANQNAVAAEAAEKVALAEKDRADARAISARAVSLLNHQPDLALLLSMEAQRLNDTIEARSSLFTGIQSRLIRALRLPPDHKPYAVWGVAFSPKGDLIASAGSDGSVILWDANTYVLHSKPLSMSTETVYSVAFSPDGKLLAGSSADGKISLWDLDTLRRTDLPAGHIGQVNSVAFSSDSRLLVSGGDDGHVILWDVKTSTQLGKPLVASTTSVRAVAFSPKGDLVASGSEEGTIRIWDTQTRQLAKSQTDDKQGHSGTVYTVAFSPDGKWLASGGNDRKVILWDAVTLKKKFELADHTHWVVAVAFSRDSNMLASGSGDRNIILWDIKSDPPNKVDSFSVHSGTVSGLAFNPNENSYILVSGSIDGTVNVLWTWQRGSSAQFIAGDDKSISALAFSQDGSTLTSVSESNLMTWNTGVISQTVELVQDKSAVSQAALSRDGTRMAVPIWDSKSDTWTTRVYNVSKNKREDTGLVTSSGKYGVLALSPDGRRLAVSYCKDNDCSDSDLTLWDVDAHKNIYSISSIGGSIKTLTFSPDGASIAAGLRFGYVETWYTTMAVLKKSVSAARFNVRGLAFSPDGSLLAVGGADSDVYILDSTTLQPYGGPLTRHRSTVRALAFSPDGNLLVSGSEDKTTLLWDVRGIKTGTVPDVVGPPLRTSDYAVTALAFNPDGKSFASGDANGQVWLWNATPDRWRAWACENANRNLTMAEWKEFFPGQPYHITCTNVMASEADFYALQGRSQDADAKFKDAVQVAIQRDDPLEMASICWLGVLDGFERDVLPVCERAVELATSLKDPYTPNYRDSRGIARALTGNRDGAIEDFKAMVQWCKQNLNYYDQFGYKRDKWIQILQAGGSPFDAKTLFDLRSESF